jgi:hypothetical protein
MPYIVSAIESCPTFGHYEAIVYSAECESYEEVQEVTTYWHDSAHQIYGDNPFIILLQVEEV